MMKDRCAHIQLAATHGELRLVKNIDANSKMIETLYIHVDFRSADWDELTKSAIYIRNGVEPVAVQIVDGCAVVPWEILDIPNDTRGDTYYEIGVIGIGSNGERLPTNRLRLKINKSCCVSTTTPKDPTPDVYATIMNMIKNLNDYNEDEIKAFVAEYLVDNNIVDKSYVDAHANNVVCHITEAERERWNTKTDITTKEDVESVIFKTVGAPNTEQFDIDENGVLTLKNIDADKVFYNGEKLSDIIGNMGTFYTWAEWS